MSRSVSLGLAATTLAFAVVLWETRRAGRVLAGVSLAAAATAAVAGVLFGLQGFSPAAMNAGMASGLLGIVLTVAAAAWVRQRNGGSRGTEMTITAHHTSQRLFRTAM